MNKRVIINADDFGLTQGVNQGIREAADAGTLTSTSVMTNCPYYEEIFAVRDKIGAGIHLVLTEGRPVLEPGKVSTLIGREGHFLPHRELTKKAVWGRLSKREVFEECSAQTQRLVELGVRPTHIDSHESFFKYPFFVPIVKAVALKFGIRAIRTYSLRRYELRRVVNPKRLIISAVLHFQKRTWMRSGFLVTDRIDSLIRFGLHYREAIGKLEVIFRDLPCGVLELVVHPGYCDCDASSLGGYAREREVELQALLSGALKKMIQESGAELINYGDL